MGIQVAQAKMHITVSQNTLLQEVNEWLECWDRMLKWCEAGSKYKLINKSTGKVAVEMKKKTFKLNRSGYLLTIFMEGDDYIRGYRVEDAPTYCPAARLAKEEELREAIDLTEFNKGIDKDVADGIRCPECWALDMTPEGECAQCLLRKNPHKKSLTAEQLKLVYREILGRVQIHRELGFASVSSSSNWKHIYRL